MAPVAPSDCGLGGRNGDGEGRGGGGGRGSSRAWRRSPRTRRLAKLPPRLPDPGRLHALAGPFPVFDQSSQIRGITAVEPARSFSHRPQRATRTGCTPNMQGFREFLCGFSLLHQNTFCRPILIILIRLRKNKKSILHAEQEYCSVQSALNGSKISLLCESSSQSNSCSSRDLVCGELSLSNPASP